MKYIRNFSDHSKYEAEMTKIPTPSVSYCRKENECHFMPSNVIMFKVGDLNGNTNQTVTVRYRSYYNDKDDVTIPITEGNKWYVHNIPSGKSLYSFKGIKEITDTIISAKLAKRYDNSILPNSCGNATFLACGTSELTHMEYMFDRCGLSSLDVSGLDTSKVTYMGGTFYGCSVKNLDLTNFNTANVTQMAGMFNSCKSLCDLNVSSFETSNVTSMAAMFANCSSLEDIDVSNFSTSKVRNMNGMFRFCGKLQTLGLSSFNTATVTDMGSMFSWCSSLQTLNLSSFNTASVTDMGNMFAWCSSLQNLDISGWDLTNVTNTTDMFYVCDKLKTIYMRNCSQATIDKIKAQLEKDKILDRVTIITE